MAWGLIAASTHSGLPLFLGSYPITPASDILHELSKRKEFGVRTFQAEDEISGIGSALGAFALIYWHAAARQTDGSELFPLVIEAQLFVWTAVLATFTGLLAAMAPALRAAKLDPVVAIRG